MTGCVPPSPTHWPRATRRSLAMRDGCSRACRNGKPANAARASVAGMTTSLLSDAFRHHIWATERVLEVCASLTPAQLEEPVPGTYGSIIDTLRHVVQADSFYLTIF